MLKKIVKPACNVCGSVEYILRGARKRQFYGGWQMPETLIWNPGIKPKLAVVK